MNLLFDVTTDKGRRKAVKRISKLRLSSQISRGIWLGKRLIGSIFFPEKDMIAAQKKAAVELIKAGRDNGVDSMTITVDQRVGFDLGSNVEGIPISCKLAKNGRIEIDVHYK